MKAKKGVMNEVVSLFILVLVISVIAGMAFLFINGLKNQVEESALKTHDVAIVNESITLNNIEDTFVYVIKTDVNCSVESIYVWNITSGIEITSPNYTITPLHGNCGLNVSSTGTVNSSAVYVSYNVSFTSLGTAFTAVNKTEAAGVTIIDYLPLLFLAMIFGVILAVVLKIILPYINLGQQVGGF